MHDKPSLRASARDHRDGIPADFEKAEQAAKLFAQALSPDKTRIFAAYWPKGSEFDVRIIIDDLVKTGIPLALPVATRGNPVMRFVLWDGTTPLKPGAFGVMEPETGDDVDPDVVIVPLLAFDRRGVRLGQGAGHYDATLADLRKRKTILAIGVCHSEQAVLFHLPEEPHDERLDMVITPDAVHDFR